MIKKALGNFKKILGLYKTRILNTISPKTDCSRKHHNDYYCDSEMPFIAFKE